LLVTSLALRFLPFAHAGTPLAPLGVDVDDEQFLREWKEHVTRVVGRLHQ